MANAFNSALASVTSFYSANQRTILIAVAVAIVAYIAYTMFWKPADQLDGFYPPGYNRYPGRESFYDPSMMDPSLMDPNMTDPTAVQTEGFESDPQHKKVVLLHTLWCPHCKALVDGDNAPWTQFEKKYKGRPDITIEKIDADKQPEVATKLGAGGFPTIKMFYMGKIFDYDGDRTLQSFEDFVNNPPSQ
jgi:thiol-disulfide isomerase/thioredoxin